MQPVRRVIWSRTARHLKQFPLSVHVGVVAAKLMFHVNVVSKIHNHLWDETTLAMRRAIRRYVKDSDRVLDLGTGHIGCLAVYCASIRDVEIIGVDINEAYVENARAVAVASGRPHIRFCCSNWLSNVEGSFDVIFSNVPYVPTQEGLRRKDPERDREIWDGGEDGCEHARRVLVEGSKRLRPNGVLLLGVNSIYVPRSAHLSPLGTACGLIFEGTVGAPWSPSDVYVFRAPN